MMGEGVVGCMCWISGLLRRCILARLEDTHFDSDLYMEPSFSLGLLSRFDGHKDECMGRGSKDGRRRVSMNRKLLAAADGAAHHLSAHDETMCQICCSFFDMLLGHV